MKFTVTKPFEVEITHVLIDVPVNYGTEEMPADFPLRWGDRWTAKVEIETGRILGWPATNAGAELHLTVKDTGSYSLLLPDGSALAEIKEDYVPNRVVPGSYGDVIHLQISPEGIITNWPKHPDVSAFFPDNDD